jgi:hypothetical protein
MCVVPGVPGIVTLIDKNIEPHFFPFLLLCPNHLLLEFTKNLRPKPFAGTRNTLAGMTPHTHADKLDHFIYKNKNFIYNLLQLITAIKATILGTLCRILIRQKRV